MLACHMLPLGPKDFKLNLLAGAMGMSIFFTLSGFLIVNGLLRNPEVGPFLVRRIFRILPLAWVGILAAILLSEVDQGNALSHFFFFANYSDSFSKTTLHFWSLCVEIHFYLFMAILVAMGRGYALNCLPFLLPFLSVMELIFKPHTGLDGMATHWRVDELLAGGCLALLYTERMEWLGKAKKFIAQVPLVFLFAFHLVSCHDFFPETHFLRPYAALMLVGKTLASRDKIFTSLLDNSFLRYIAAVSYALYVIHPFTLYGWVSEGDTMVRYTKRILSFGMTFGLAHVSTHYFESYFTNLGRSIAKRIRH